MNRTLPIAAVCLISAGAIAGVASIRHRTATAATATAAVASSIPRAPLVAASSSCVDADGDGYGQGCAKGLDCNDNDASVHPGAVEACNGRDDDCNALVDDTPSCPAPARRTPRVSVPAGAFDMGSMTGAVDERPVHHVRGAAFDLDRYEVTNARYAACVSAKACSAPTLASSKLRARYYEDDQFADYPVVFVGWSQADAYCKWAGGRLPTEAEWERAARGTDGPRTYPWGDSAPDCTKSNMSGCVGDTDLVGRREEGASPYGAMDMAGNVWEWTADWYDAAYYTHAPQSEPKGPDAGQLKVMRGGCWVSGASSLRTTCRKAELPASWAPNVGFRCVYSASAAGATNGGAK